MFRILIVLVVTQLNAFVKIHRTGVNFTIYYTSINLKKLESQSMTSNIQLIRILKKGNEENMGRGESTMKFLRNTCISNN